jgi:hypothetical protein
MRTLLANTEHCEGQKYWKVIGLSNEPYHLELEVNAKPSLTNRFRLPFHFQHPRYSDPNHFQKQQSFCPKKGIRDHVTLLKYAGDWEEKEGQS